MKVIATVAVSLNGIMGKDGKLPWKAPSDLARFREATIGKVLLMGRKTWDSLPADKLPGRVCNVVTTKRNLPRWHPEGAIGVFSNTPHAVDILTGILRQNPHLPQELHLIGGAQLLEEAFNERLVDEVHLTRIHARVDGDVAFQPKWLRDFKLKSDEPLNVRPDEVEQSLEIYVRNNNVAYH